MYEEEDYEEYDDYDLDDELMRFDCTCGAWRFNQKTKQFTHTADCICGSSEPFGNY